MISVGCIHTYLHGGTYIHTDIGHDIHVGYIGDRRYVEEETGETEADNHFKFYTYPTYMTGWGYKQTVRGETYTQIRIFRCSLKHRYCITKMDIHKQYIHSSHHIYTTCISFCDFLGNMSPIRTIARKIHLSARPHRPPARPTARKARSF